MASAWGLSWASAWGASWGASSPAPAAIGGHFGGKKKRKEERESPTARREMLERAFDPPVIAIPEQAQAIEANVPRETISKAAEREAEDDDEILMLFLL